MRPPTSPSAAGGARRPVLVAAAAALALSVLAASCARVEATDEVGAVDVVEEYSIATSTTLPGSGAGAAVGGATRTRTAGGAGGTDSEQLVATVEQFVAQLQSDPAALARLLGVDQAQLAAILGVDPNALGGVVVSPQFVQALAGVLGGLDPATIGRLSSGNGRLDPALTATILGLASTLDPAIGVALRGIDPGALATLVTTATRVDPQVLDALGAVLAVVDPAGLGALANDRNALAILAVLFGVALRTDPNQFAVLGQAAALDPNLNAALDGIAALVGQFTPALINQLNGIARILTPDVLRALSAGLALIQRPEVAEVIQQAAADPVTLITTLGVAVLLVPGLAEAVAPGTFADPQARYTALLGLLVAAVVNLQGIDLEQLLNPPAPAG